MKSKQNITLQLDKQTIRKAKILAAKRGTSVSRMLSEEIARMVGEEEAYESARSTALELLKEGFHLGGATTATRDELHER